MNCQLSVSDCRLEQSVIIANQETDAANQISRSAIENWQHPLGARVIVSCSVVQAQAASERTYGDGDRLHG